MKQQFSIDAAMARGSGNTSSIILTAGAAVLPGNPRRLAITFYPHATDSYRVYPGVATAATAFGVLLTPGDRPYTMLISEYGPVVREGMYLTGTAGDYVNFTEVIARAGDFEQLDAF